MAKLKFDVSGQEYGTAQDFEQAPIGLYFCKVVELKPHKKKGDSKPTSLHLVAKPIKDAKGKKLKANYSQLHKYIGLGESSEWLYAQLLEALGIATKSKRKGTLDTDKQEGKIIMIRVKAGVGEDGESYRAEVGGMFPPKKDADLDDEEEEDDELEDEESDEEDEDDEDSEDEDEDDDEEDLEDEEEESYDEWTLADLRKEAVKRKLLKKSEAERKKKKTLIALLEEDDAEEEEEEESEDEELEDEESEDEDEDEEDEDEDEEEEVDYSEMELKDLRKEVVSRKLMKKKDAEKKKKATLIKALEADDAEDDDEEESPF